MLVDQVEETLEVDEDEAILEVADYVADRKDLAVEDGVVGLLAHYLERILGCVLLLVVIGHVLRKLVTLGLRFHPDKNYPTEEQASTNYLYKKRGNTQSPMIGYT